MNRYCRFWGRSRWRLWVWHANADSVNSDRKFFPLILKRTCLTQLSENCVIFITGIRVGPKLCINMLPSYRGPTFHHIAFEEFLSRWPENAATYTWNELRSPTCGSCSADVWSAKSTPRPLEKRLCVSARRASLRDSRLWVRVWHCRVYFQHGLLVHSLRSLCPSLCVQ